MLLQDHCASCEIRDAISDMPVAESRGSQSRRKTQRTSKPQGSLNNDLSKVDENNFTSGVKL